MCRRFCCFLSFKQGVHYRNQICRFNETPEIPLLFLVVLIELCSSDMSKSLDSTKS